MPTLFAPPPFSFWIYSLIEFGVQDLCTEVLTLCIGVSIGVCFAFHIRLCIGMLPNLTTTSFMASMNDYESWISIVVWRLETFFSIGISFLKSQLSSAFDRSSYPQKTCFALTSLPLILKLIGYLTMTLAFGLITLFTSCMSSQVCKILNTCFFSHEF